MVRGRGAAIVAAVLLMLTMASPSVAHAGERDRACAWVLEPTFDRENVLFPEVTTRYLGAITPVPAGGYVEIKGEFPRARYMSLQTYSSTLQSLTVLRDEQIAPDPGSANPYLPGADRTVTRRSYTVRIVNGRPPAIGRPPNTLYNQNADGSQMGNGLAYRIYLADKGAGPFGGVAAPRLSFHLPGGQALPVPTCPDLVPDTSALSETVAGLGAPVSLPTTGVLAYRRPLFHKYINAPTSYALGVTDNSYLGALTPAVTAVTKRAPSGLGENADNKYVAAYLSQEFGQVLTLRAKMPTTPRTFEGERTMGTGQLRFWSMCTGFRGTQTWGCVVDKDVPLDRRRRYTIVVSTPNARPANATRRCGVAWLPWGPDPKGIAIMRNMLPADGFAHAVQRATDGTERRTLGAYYPVGTYSSTEGFERRGCPRR